MVLDSSKEMTSGQLAHATKKANERAAAAAAHGNSRGITSYFAPPPANDSLPPPPVEVAAAAVDEAATVVNGGMENAEIPAEAVLAEAAPANVNSEEMGTDAPAAELGAVGIKEYDHYQPQVPFPSLLAVRWY